MQPMLHRLQQRHPGARIDVLAPPWTEKLLRQMPEVHDVIINPFPHGTLRLSARRRLGVQLRDAQYDQAIVLPNSWKSALVPFFADIPVRTGFVGEMRYGLLNDARKLNKKKLPLMVERFAQLAEAPSIEDPASAARPSSASERCTARTNVEQTRIDTGQTSRRVLPRCGIRPGQTLAAAVLRRTGAAPARTRLCSLADRLAQRQRSRRHDRRAGQRTVQQSVRQRPTCAMPSRYCPAPIWWSVTIQV